jgi:hypothetical protein
MVIDGDYLQKSELIQIDAGQFTQHYTSPIMSWTKLEIEPQLTVEKVANIAVRVTNLQTGKFADVTFKYERMNGICSLKVKKCSGHDVAYITDNLIANSLVKMISVQAVVQNTQGDILGRKNWCYISAPKLIA